MTDASFFLESLNLLTAEPNSLEVLYKIQKYFFLRCQLHFD